MRRYIVFRNCVFISVLLFMFVAGTAQSQVINLESTQGIEKSDELVDRVNVDVTVKIGDKILGTPRLSTVPGGHVQFTSTEKKYRVKLNFLDQQDEAFKLVPESMAEMTEDNRSLILTEIYLPITGSDSGLSWSRVASSMMSLSNEGGQASSTVPINNAYLLEDLTLADAESAQIELRLQKTEMLKSLIPATKSCDIELGSIEAFTRG